MEKEVIETQTSRIWFGEDGIIRNIVIPQAEVSLNDAKDVIDALYIVTREKRSPLFVDMRKIKSIKREARVYLSGNKSKVITSAVAILIDSSVSRMIGNLFIGINKPNVPTKLFTSEDKAIEWLKGFVEKDNEEGDQ